MRAVQTRGIFGQPAAHSAQTSFRPEAIAAGLAGEQATAELINGYGNQAMIFHGLKLPIKLRTDIDHLIVRDRALLAIDSKYWTAGRYWSVGGNLYRGLEKIASPQAMTQALKALLPMLPMHISDYDVVTVVHSKGGKARIGRSTRKLAQPMVGATSAQMFIDRWLADHPGEPSEHLADELLTIFRKGAGR